MLIFAFLVLAVLFAVISCGGQTTATTAAGAEVAVTVAASTTTATTANTEEPTTTTTVPPTTTTTELTTTTATELPTTTTAATAGVSSESLAYAESLGGKSHDGEMLYFVIGASVKTEEQAQVLLEGAKAVGDMQSYFIVQRSDNFQGMSPGWWVVFEAYREYPSPDNLAFCRRPFPDAYVKSATVRTSDPIPVYEDM